MEVKAYNIEDFEKQYYMNFENKNPIDINIELKTNDIFWEELTKDSYNNICQSLSFIGAIPPNFDSIKQLYVPNYGNIKRV